MEDCILNAYVTNLGRYNEGELVGKWLVLPAAREEVRECLRRIGIDGLRYEEFFITDYDSTIDGLCRVLGEYESLDALNYLAVLLDEMQGGYDKLEAALAYGDHTGSVAELIELILNLDSFTYYDGITNEEELGAFLVQECGTKTIPADMEQYFDYEAYGRDVALDEGGIFTANGYFICDGYIAEEYDETQIPEEYRVNAALKRGGVSYATLKGGEEVKREFKCAECGAACDMSQMYTVGGRNICATCADEKTFVCEDCGGRFWWVEDKSETLCVPCYCVRRERED